MYNTNQKSCTLHVSVNKNRVKVYGNSSEKSVYLRDGQNFEIELHNPKNVKVLAKISLNGNSISSSGIVLRPGQRVFIERFIDEPKKFEFSTYEVEDSSENKKAIQNNGLVEVQFFDEFVPFTTSAYDGIYWSNTNNYNVPGSLYFTNTAGTNYLTGTSTLTAGSFSNININCSNQIETGSVEKGSHSEQQFVNVSGSFNSFPSSSEKIKIYPNSLKPIEMTEVRNYCTNCGARARKSGWKFCPSCGNKF